MLPEMLYIENDLLPMLRETWPEITLKNVNKQLSQWAGEPGVFCDLRGVDTTKSLHIPDYNHQDIHWDCEKMFASQLKSVLGPRSDRVPSIRADMGCGLIGALFGLRQTLFIDKRPWLLDHLTREQIMSLEPGEFTINQEYEQALEHMRYMKRMLSGTGIELYPLDLQGPVDSAHLLYGDAFFYELYDDPFFVKHLFDIVHAALVKLMQDSFDIIKPETFVAHYNSLVLPMATPLKISEDTSTLLSKEHIHQYCIPYTNALLEHFGGGYIHYCGWNPHLYDAVTSHMPRVVGLNFGNPEKHDMPFVLRDLAERKKYYYGMINDDMVEYSKKDGVWYLFRYLYS